MRSVISPDFVEENGAHVSRFELARLITIGAGEAALHVSEQLGFEQGFRETSAVHGSKHVSGSGAPGMNRPRHDFLANPALTGDEHLGIGPCHTVDFLFECGHLRASTSQLHVRPWPDGGADRAHASTARGFSHTINHCS
jgi:hypothetical protein